MAFTAAMELKSSKISLLVVVLYTISLLPDGSEAYPMFTEQRDYCGKTSVKDMLPGQTVERQMPWVVGIVATEGGKSRTCTGTVFTPRLVLTSEFCAPKNPTRARYVINYGFGRQKQVGVVHGIEGSPFILLEIPQPFEAVFSICLAFSLSTLGLNDTVWTASWVDGRGASAAGSVHQEQWTLLEESSPSCKVACKASEDYCMCAVAKEVGENTCQNDEGKAVMRWDGRQWYLDGVVVKANLEGGKCANEGRRERSYQWITPRVTMKIGKLVDTFRSYFLNEPV